MIYENQVIDRETLKAYILRQLGGTLDPNNEASHDVELREDQVEDIIDDTMIEFLNEIYDGHEKCYLQMNLVDGVVKYTLPPDTLQVLKIHLAINNASVFRQAFINEMTDPFFAMGGFTYLDYQILNMHLNQIDSMTRVPVNFTFNSRSKTLKIFDTKNVSKVMLEIIKYTGENDTEFDNLFGHQYIKEMCVARAFNQWYINLIKYKGQIYDGNLEIDKEAIGEIGKAKFEKCQQDLRDKWSDSFGLVYSN